MRHRKAGRKLGRSSSHRDAMLRNMVTSLLEEEKIQTTTAKAKELRRVTERLIGLARRHPPSVVEEATSDADKAKRQGERVAAVRQAGKIVRDKYVLEKLFGELAERYQARNGGYTRIMKMENRPGDNAQLAIIELMPDFVASDEAETSPEEETEEAATA